MTESPPNGSIKTNGSGDAHLPGVGNPTLPASIPAEKNENDFLPDQTGLFEVGKVVSEEGDVFVGVDSEGKVLLRRPNGEDHMIDYAYLAAARNELEQDEPGGGATLHDRLSADLEANEQAALPDHLKGIQDRHSGDVHSRVVLSDKYISSERREFEESYLSESLRIYQAVAARLGITEADPTQLLATIESKLEAAGETAAPTKEADKGTQIEDKTEREKHLATLLAALKEGRGSEVIDEHLHRFRTEPEVRAFVAEDI